MPSRPLPTASLINMKKIDIKAPHMTNPQSNYIDNLNVTDTQSSEEDKAYIIPLKIILPIEHAHPVGGNASSVEDNEIQRHYLKYKYLMLKTNDANYHGHLANDQPERLKLASNDLLLLPKSSSSRHPSAVPAANLTNELNVTTTTTTEPTHERQLLLPKDSPDVWFVGDDGLKFKATADNGQVISGDDTTPLDFVNVVPVRDDVDVSDLEAERNVPFKQQPPVGGYVEPSATNALGYYRKLAPWLTFTF